MRLKKISSVLLVLFAPAFILIFISTRGCKHNFKELDYFGLAENYTFFDSQGKKHSTEEFKDYTVLINVYSLHVLMIVLFLFIILTI